MTLLRSVLLAIVAASSLPAAANSCYDSCPSGHFGICTAAITPETLANERATGSQATDTPGPTTVPREARILTYHYESTDRAQARIDCESAGGEWSQ